MFRETLLESAPGARRRKRWPMILAVALEVTVCSLLVALPLVSTGIIPIAARTPVVFTEVQQVHVVQHEPTNRDGGRGPVTPQPSVVQIADGRPHIWPGPSVATSDDNSGGPPNFAVGPTGSGIPICDACNAKPGGPGEGNRPVRLSQGVTEGRLLRKVEPIYPRMAMISGIGGEVRLHAIISKDGTIQSLTVMSGHPLLVTAAVEAVRQWRYRPYLLNDEPVEVETLITVNFTRAR